MPSLYSKLSYFWHGDRRWSGYKATTILATAGVMQQLLNDYWLLTNINMLPEENMSLAGEVIGKSAYIITQMLLSAIYTGGIGLGVDYLRSIYNQDNSTSEMTLIHN